MCIAIYAPAGTDIPMDHLIQGQKHNPDGCGMAWVENGVTNIFKSMNFAEFMNKYYDVKARLGDIAMLVHFRITSRGKTTVDMCHPFMVDDKICIIHNGTISNIKEKECKDGASDTKVLAENYLANLPEEWYKNEAISKLLESFIGWSKVCILVPTDEESGADVYILNEDSGHWEGGIWYSNRSYVDYTKNVQRTTNVTHFPAKSTSSNSSVTVYTPPKQAQSDFFFEVCDGCNKDANYNKLTAKNGMLYCESCLRKFDRENGASGLFSTTVYRPCAGCRTLTDRDEMWEVGITFNESLIEHPQQLEAFQKELMHISIHLEDYATGYMCEECYMDAVTAINHDILSVEVLDYPEKYDVPDEDNVIAVH